MSHSCPACPSEIRNLYAVAHNLICRIERKACISVIYDKVRDLKDAVKKVEPLVSAHFEEVKNDIGG